MEETAFKKQLRGRLLDRIRDLKEKIETNEPFPEGEQDIDFLIEADDRVEEILNNWYY